MVKKIKKYLKFVVCCALILSLIAPSYAALSASDGSAFVTKAEFDSALADFNARLTTFEAGINSKIDSQVTSYLDRNGIWNGQQQQFDIIDRYEAAGILGKDTTLNIWWVGKNKVSQFEQYNLFTATTGVDPVIADYENSMTINWGGTNSKTYTATYKRGDNQGMAYLRIYMMDDVFVAQKSGLAFLQVPLSWGGMVRYWQPKYSFKSVSRTAYFNTPDWPWLFDDYMGAARPQLISFWYPTATKVAGYGARDDDNLYPWASVSPAYEYLPAWAIGAQIIDAGGVMTPYAGNFFVEKNKSYGMGVKPFYCWSSEDYPWFVDDSYKVWDTSSYARLYFGGASQWYARFVPRLAIY